MRMNFEARAVNVNISVSFQHGVWHLSADSLLMYGLLERMGATAAAATGT